MTNFLRVIPTVLTAALVVAVPLLISGASAQQQSQQAQQQGQQDACARDVSRFCRAHINDDDMIVLACLKQNRPRLSKGCEKVLTDHGQ